jgi:hypothetical protein
MVFVFLFYYTSYKVCELPATGQWFPPGTPVSLHQ